MRAVLVRRTTGVIKMASIFTTFYFVLLFAVALVAAGAIQHN
jgi:hypothetical protein